MKNTSPDDIANVGEVSPVDMQLDSVASILSNLDDVPSPNRCPSSEPEKQIVAVQLGLASSLFQALRVRHASTAAHSLRVAFGCSSWSNQKEMSEEDRYDLVVAALLHDIGKVGAPDDILKQATSLTTDQAAQINETRRYGLEILSSCCESTTVLQSIAYAGAWYDGSCGEYSRRGEEIPCAARIIAIVDAFDAMTTDRIYRKAIPHELAIAELLSCAGSQFDPVLVDEFAMLHAQGLVSLTGQVASRWLKVLQEPPAHQLWRLQLPENDVALASQDELRYRYLFDSIQDGAFFIDSAGIINAWNDASERLTGISLESLQYQKWDPALLKMKHGDGRIVRCQDCPIMRSLSSAQEARVHVMVRGAGDSFLQIDMQIVPIVASDGYQKGTLVLMRDATSEQHLEERVNELHQQATSDPLTGVANRAEFDRRHNESIKRHTEQLTTCSLIICDIDRFKMINDEYGHQAGDEALISFANILKRSCREGDLVARYGGEEFVMVCEDCVLSQAAKIAESIRKELECTPLRELGGRCIAASFGVTELQPGDTPETMLRRADRGLLQAKQTGRNKVVQLGSGMVPSTTSPSRFGSWWPWSRAKVDKPLTTCCLSTRVPLPLVAEKLRGFVSDHNAQIIDTSKDHVIIDVTTQNFHGHRRSTDRPIPFRLELRFEPHTREDTSLSGPRTIIHVALNPAKTRDRRASVDTSARSLLRSLQAYLMAQTYVAGDE